MCGIAGAIRPGGTTPSDRRAVASIADHLGHRGPDGDGVHEGHAVQLAMRRLAIIGRADGDQPLTNDDGTLALVANGEIYNHVEVREALRAEGVRFTTGSDCEAILRLYEQRGSPAFVDELRGMFAFALVDTRRGKLVLGRDRMGEKPLYLHRQGHALFFSSELRALVAAGVVPFELDPLAVDGFFHWSFVPEPRSPLADVTKLPAASVMTVDLQTGQQDVRRYWSLADAPPLEEHPATALRRQLDDTFSIILRAETPVGVALSGGMDSGLLAALAARAQPDVRAFTVGYRGRPASDERSAAAETAAALGVPFVATELDEASVIDTFPSNVLARDEPIADIAAPGYLAVAQLARQQGVPVLLLGHGGDELFWGYEWVRTALAFNRAAAGGVTALADVRLAAGGRGARQRLRASLEACFLSAIPRPKHALIFAETTRGHQETEAWRLRLYGDELRSVPWSNTVSPFTREVDDDASLQVALTQLICDTYLKSNGVAQADRLCMAASVEPRLPLLDHRFVETVIGLRKVAPDADRAPKAWLREVAEPLLPSAATRGGKRGFTPPTDRWVDGLVARYGNLVAGGVLVERGLLRRRGAEALLSARGRSAIPLKLRVLVLELWCRGVLGEGVMAL